MVLTEVKVLIEQWLKEYNQVRTHSSSGYRPPAPEVGMPATLAWRTAIFAGQRAGVTRWKRCRS